MKTIVDTLYGLLFPMDGSYKSGRGRGGGLEL